MTFKGRFRDSLVVEQLDKVSLSFLADDLEVRRGGVAANIAFGMANLGQRPILVGAVGEDFADYRSWLERHGVDCESVHVSESKHTARFVCTTDEDMAQIATFYAGAMSEARADRARPHRRPGRGPRPRRHRRQRPRGDAAAHPRVPHPRHPLRRRPEPAARLRRRRDHPPAHRRRRLPADQRVRGGADRAEDRAGRRTRSPTASPPASSPGARTAWSSRRRGEEPIEIKVAREVRRADPTGVGDAFRAGFLTGLAAGLGHRHAAELGSMLATYVIETVGTQEYTLGKARFLAAAGRRLRPAVGRRDRTPHRLHRPLRR